MLRSSQFEIDLLAWRATWAGTPVRLTPRAYDPSHPEILLTEAGVGHRFRLHEERIPLLPGEGWEDGRKRSP